jgi:uncharacterized glyoxalase superfamily protein PhnB
MIQKIKPFLWFDTQAEEAVKFYCSVFKNSKILEIARYPEGGPAPAGSVMIVNFELEGMQFVALNAGPLFKFTEAISFVVTTESQQETDYYWNRLTADWWQGIGLRLAQRQIRPQLANHAQSSHRPAVQFRQAKSRARHGRNDDHAKNRHRRSTTRCAIKETQRPRPSFRAERASLPQAGNRSSIVGTATM